MGVRASTQPAWVCACTAWRGGHTSRSGSSVLLGQARGRCDGQAAADQQSETVGVRLCCWPTKHTAAVHIQAWLMSVVSRPCKKPADCGHMHSSHMGELQMAVSDLEVLTLCGQGCQGGQQVLAAMASDLSAQR